MHPFIRAYQKAVLGYPIQLLLVFAVLLGGLSLGVQRFELDASAESLVLENDPDLAAFRDVAERFGGEDFLLVTYTPPEPLFSEPALRRLRELRDALTVVPRVSQINSILDVPLLENPRVPISQMMSNIKTLEHPAVDLTLAEQELANSPLYHDLLLNREANTSVIQLVRPYDHQHRTLTKAREQLWQHEGTLSHEQQVALAALNQQIKVLNIKNAQLLRQDIAQIRQILAPFQASAEIYLGGVPMIANDMTLFVERDLATFGVGVLLFLVLLLLLIFRRIRWVLIALGCCGVTVLSMVGILGFLRWPVTVISSNFMLLLLILTMSMCIHLMVRYREAHAAQPTATQYELVQTTVTRMFKPCLFMALTTMVAFGSLVLSGIRPVIDFGWMMSIGVLVALLVTFTVLPALLMLIGRRTESGNVTTHSWLTDSFANLTLRHGRWIVWSNMILATLVAVGIARLEVENSFINYFKADTEIRRGMLVVDQRLGGTTPLDVIVQFPSAQSDADEPEADPDFDFGFEQSADEAAQYWLTPDKVAEIKAVHQYLEAQPEVGKVVSLATMMEIAERLNGAPLSAVELALLYSAIPAEFRSIVLDPYMDAAAGQLRVSMRIKDSLPDLRRSELLARIDRELHSTVGLAQQDYQLTGMMVLYNNMLQSLFQSQIMTLGAVFLAITLMFVLLFGSLSVALLAMLPNLLSAGVVMAAMGWLRIPLDMMTITIAAITVGIAVDTTIHYIHRFKTELQAGASYPQALRLSHGSIGRAIGYTSVTIAVGFSILALSNFTPTIVFGVLTALAMLVALLMVLTLLPLLLVMFKPFRSEG